MSPFSLALLEALDPAKGHFAEKGFVHAGRLLTFIEEKMNTNRGMRQIPVIDRQVSSVLDHADQGVTPILLLITVVNGIAEELFFRGALYAAVPRYPVVWSTVAYVVATLATGNFMLAFAAVLLGVVVGLERRASGGILAPILTHVTWSTVMLFALPLLF